MKTLTRNIYETIKDVIVQRRRAVVTLVHLLQAVIANYLAFLLRFDAALPKDQVLLFRNSLAILLSVRLAFYLIGGLHRDLWRYSSIRDLVKLIRTVTLGSLLFFVIERYLLGHVSYPRSIFLIDWLLLIIISGGSRLLIRVFREYTQEALKGKRTLIIGAGDAAEMIVRDMKNNPHYHYVPIGFIDDNIYKKGLSIHGLPIFGPRTMLREILEKHHPEEILVAIPSEAHRIMREVYEDCRTYRIPIKTLPSMSAILDGAVSVSQLRPLALEDLLQREPVKTDIAEVKKFIEGKRVLVTGAGGSIGSELCRQLLRYRPVALVMLDRYENGLFDIDRELRQEPGSLSGYAPELSAIVGDMTDAAAMERLFSGQRPQIVFHAAAHKHVPLMEHNPLEAVRNNVFGTRMVLDAALKHGVENFVMISTDKAVNPTNVMGATKRVAEFLTLGANASGGTKCTTVRFGNVLGSNGSVIHIFREQLKHGGPLTVTHPEIRRFFMLIPEAVQLVLIAASTGRGGEIFVLDMGEQIRIRDLAENLISLSGFLPNEDIRIEYIGLRPGEKLYEELFDETETAGAAVHDKIHRVLPRELPDPVSFGRNLAELEDIVRRSAPDELIPALRKVVTNFRRQS